MGSSVAPGAGVANVLVGGDGVLVELALGERGVLDRGAGGAEVVLQGIKNMKIEYTHPARIVYSIYNKGLPRWIQKRWPFSFSGRGQNRVKFGTSRREI